MNVVEFLMRCPGFPLPPLVRLVPLCLALLLLAVPATAQQDPAGGAAAQGGESASVITVGGLEELIATLEDEASRQAFLEDLKALVAAQEELAGAEEAEAAPSLVSRIADRLANVDVAVEELIAELDDGSGLIDWFEVQIETPMLRRSWVEALWQVTGTLVLAVGLAFILRRLTWRQLARLEARRGMGWAERVLVALGRALLLLVPIAGFATVGYVALMFIDPNSLARIVAVTLINATIAVRLVNLVSRCLFSPLAAALRPLPMSDEQAAYLFIWTGRLAAIGVYGFFAVDLLSAFGLPDSSAALLIRLVGFAVAAMLMIVILQSRDVVADWIRHHPESGAGWVLRQRLADIWHVLACVAVFIVFAVWMLDVHGGFVYLLRGFGGTGVALFVGLLASTLLRRLLQRLFRISTEMSRRFPGLDRRSNRYVAILSWALNAVIWWLVALALLEAWGVGVFDLFVTPHGVDVVARVIAIGVIATVAVIVWELGDGMIARALTDQSTHTLTPRMKTLLPLFRNVLMVTVAAIAVATILSEMGVNIGPLLAGAGIVGIAVGFGAQTLVKDIITGAFMLFEDQFSVGDWIDAGGKTGGVESISIRTVRLRDIDGYVHTVPFGEITALTNMMRDFGYAVIDVGVAYKENTDEVLEVIREVDARAREDEEFAERLVGDLEIMGVTELGDSAVTLRVRVKTVAGFQWGVRREYLRRIKLRFDEVGIEIPFPHMTVWFGEMKGEALSPVAHVRIDAETIGKGDGDDSSSAQEAAAGSSPPPTEAQAPPGEGERT